MIWRHIKCLTHFSDQIFKFCFFIWVLSILINMFFKFVLWVKMELRQYCSRHRTVAEQVSSYYINQWWPCNLLINASSGFEPQCVQVAAAWSRLKCFPWPKGFRDVRDYKLFISSLDTICSVEQTGKMNWSLSIDLYLSRNKQWHSRSIIIAPNMKCAKTKRTIWLLAFLVPKVKLYAYFTCVFSVLSYT